MTLIKKSTILLSAVFALGLTTVTAFAASDYQTPDQIVAALTNRTVEDVQDEKLESGKTYGNIAYEAGKLEEFKQEMFQIKKERIMQNVNEGILTQEEADEILATMQENQETCLGDGNGGTRNYKGCSGNMGFCNLAD